jgi:hypothetical protein
MPASSLAGEEAGDRVCAEDDDPVEAFVERLTASLRYEQAVAAGSRGTSAARRAGAVFLEDRVDRAL